MKTTILSIIIFILIFILTSCSFEASGKIERMKFAELRDSVFSRFIKIKEDTTNFEDCIKIKPFNKVLMGTLINIKLDNLPQNKNITLHAYRKNWEGLIYSFACFKTDSKGQIQLNKDKPISATYSGVDSLGIFWSMTKPTYINEELPFEIKNLKLNTIYFQLEVDGKIISKDELRLILETPDIYCEEIRNKDMVANYYYPKNKQNLPLIIMLGGSNGGIREVDDRAKIVSSHGYAVLALGYFGMENLPKNLERIPLEYFFNSIDWAKEKQFIDTAKIVIIGVSKGGEAALLVASMRRDIKGAIAFVPSNVRWQGIPDGPSFISKSSWTLNGNDLPYLKCSFSFSFFWKFICKSKQIEMREIFKPIITEDKSKIDPALIEVEKINGPILLIAGKDDKLWPSYDMCQMMKYRLDSLKFEHQIECLNYDNAGHFIFGPDLMPTINYKYDQIAVGGKDSENSAAQIDSWNKMIGFLQTYFPVE
ncbi:MAG: acyl-CoA thioesterase/bile acid-CoA:amino acid N-acyltransferase family protein [Bacteroidota bacterium]